MKKEEKDKKKKQRCKRRTYYIRYFWTNYKCITKVYKFKAKEKLGFIRNIYRFLKCIVEKIII